MKNLYLLQSDIDIHGYYPQYASIEFDVKYIGCYGGKIIKPYHIYLAYSGHDPYTGYDHLYLRVANKAPQLCSCSYEPLYKDNYRTIRFNITGYYNDKASVFDDYRFISDYSLKDKKARVRVILPYNPDPFNLYKKPDKDWMTTGLLYINGYNKLTFHGPQVISTSYVPRESIILKDDRNNPIEPYISKIYNANRE